MKSLLLLAVYATWLFLLPVGRTAAQQSLTHAGTVSVSIGNATVAEQDGTVSLTVSVSNRLTQPLRVHFDTRDGSARHPQDYRKNEGWVLIPAGMLSTTVNVRIVADQKVEPTEYFRVGINLDKREYRARIGDGEGLVTIVNGETSWIQLRSLVVVYRNTPAGYISPSFMDTLKPALAETRLFLWRNSHMALNAKWTVEVFNNFLPRVHSGSIFTSEVESDLYSRGYTDSSFEQVIVIAKNGGIDNAGDGILGNAAVCGIPWGDIGVTSRSLVFSIDDMLNLLFEQAGHPEYPTSQVGQARVLNEFIPHSGRFWDLHTEILRHWPRSSWLELGRPGNRGIICSSIDNDRDSIPDNDADVPLDERRFKSNSLDPDTDNDGLSDLQETLAGNFTMANPRKPDSDHDGTNDSDDRAPVIPLNNVVPYGAGYSLSQEISLWPCAGRYAYRQTVTTSASLYLAYSHQYLLIGVKGPAIPGSITIDANDDGLYYGNDNITFSITKEKGVAYATAYLSDLPPGSPRDYVISEINRLDFPSAIRYGEGWESFQMAIPVFDRYNIQFVPGRKMAVSISIGDRVLSSGEVIDYGSIPEPDDYFSIILGDTMSLPSCTIVRSRVAPDHSEAINGLSARAFPNPFAYSFILEWDSKIDHPVAISILDAMGRAIESRTVAAANGSLQLGNGWNAGIYYAVIAQGDKKIPLKLVKER